MQQTTLIIFFIIITHLLYLTIYYCCCCLYSYTNDGIFKLQSRTRPLKHTNVVEEGTHLHIIQWRYIAHSIYRYTTGGYNAIGGVKQISPPKEGQSVMDKQVGVVLQQEPLLLSQTPFWWANPFQFFSLPVILLFTMIVFLIIRTAWAHRSKARTLEEAKVKELVEKSKTPAGRRRLSISERTVVRKSFIEKYAQEVAVVNLVLEEACHHARFLRLSTPVF